MIMMEFIPTIPLERQKDLFNEQIRNKIMWRIIPIRNTLGKRQINTMKFWIVKYSLMLIRIQVML